MGTQKSDAKRLTAVTLGAQAFPYTAQRFTFPFTKKNCNWIKRNLTKKGYENEYEDEDENEDGDGDDGPSGQPGDAGNSQSLAPDP